MACSSVGGDGPFGHSVPQRWSCCAMASGPTVTLVQCEKSPVPGAGDRDKGVLGQCWLPHASLKGLWVPWAMSHRIWQALTTNVVLWLIFGSVVALLMAPLHPVLEWGWGRERRP